MVHLPTVIMVGIACSAWLYEFLPDPTEDEDAEHKWLATAMILNRAAIDGWVTFTLGHGRRAKGLAGSLTFV
jgi:hypothetical protein